MKYLEIKKEFFMKYKSLNFLPRLEICKSRVIVKKFESKTWGKNENYNFDRMSFSDDGLRFVSRGRF